MSLSIDIGEPRRPEGVVCQFSGLTKNRRTLLFRHMPSKVRIQFEGARYHVINRGNYRGDVFVTQEAAESFLRTLAQAAERYEWKVHAYVLMRNHYHLAIETPRPNLPEGMHWLQGTFACRFNRFRKQNGRLFQGPYKALLIEDTKSLCRVVDYIHLNPVRAGAVTAAQVGQYAWSSLKAFRSKKEKRGAVWLTASEWLAAKGGGKDAAKSMAAYEKHLVELGNNEAAQKEAGLVKLSQGWAIGTEGWKQALARECAQCSKVAEMGLGREELAEIRNAHNESALEQALKNSGRREDELKTRPKMQEWKIAMAREMRQSGVPVAWLAKRLHLGKATTARTALWQAKRQEA